MAGFVKVQQSTLDSSIWDAPWQVRILWITLLLMASSRGRVRASVPGLAHRARLSLPETEEALAVLLGPDAYSSDGTTGERIAKVDGGWAILNFKRYREYSPSGDKVDSSGSLRERASASGPDAGVASCGKLRQVVAGCLSASASASASASDANVSDERARARWPEDASGESEPRLPASAADHPDASPGTSFAASTIAPAPSAVPDTPPAFRHAHDRAQAASRDFELLAQWRVYGGDPDGLGPWPRPAPPGGRPLPQLALSAKVHDRLCEGHAARDLHRLTHLLGARVVAGDYPPDRHRGGLVWSGYLESILAESEAWHAAQLERERIAAEWLAGAAERERLRREADAVAPDVEFGDN